MDDSCYKHIADLHKILILNDEDSQKNIREIIQKDNETERKLEVQQVQLNMLHVETNNLAIDQSYQHARANNLEMKLRKRGYLSKEHAIDYVPYINLPDKHKRGAAPPTTHTWALYPFSLPIPSLIEPEPQ